MKRIRVIGQSIDFKYDVMAFQKTVYARLEPTQADLCWARLFDTREQAEAYRLPEALAYRLPFAVSPRQHFRYKRVYLPVVQS